MDNRKRCRKSAKAAAEIKSQKLKTVVSDTSNLAGIAVLEKAVAESGMLLLFPGTGASIAKHFAAEGEGCCKLCFKQTAECIPMLGALLKNNKSRY